MKKLALFALVTSVAVLPAFTGVVAQTRSDSDRSTGATEKGDKGAMPDRPKGATQDHTKDDVERRAAGRMSGAEGLIHSNRLIGAKIENTEGKNLGKIDRLLVDSDSGRISQVVIQTGGFAGIAAKHVVVPWSEVKSAMQHDRDRVVVRMDQATLDKAPAWEAREERRGGSSSASPRTERDRSSTPRPSGSGATGGTSR